MGEWQAYRLDRLTEAARPPLRVMKEEYEAACARIGARGLPISGLERPLGMLVRHANTAEVYSWVLQEPERVHPFLSRLADAAREYGRR